ncbi:3701_t:CDS:2 [Cetraspora pellucida]|uniref:3701_t:CDS:1 n=1 Tax=Cetraspora pellucida TaxID=1433469 RepID=A0A9N9DZX7_9GLOM|nr:3701_t:CDS:2 [Cetraspora pellucida]
MSKVESFVIIDFGHENANFFEKPELISCQRRSEVYEKCYFVKRIWNRVLKEATKRSYPQKSMKSKSD